MHPEGRSCAFVPHPHQGESRSDLAWSQRRLHLRCLSRFDGGATLLLRSRLAFSNRANRRKFGSQKQGCVRPTNPEVHRPQSEDRLLRRREYPTGWPPILLQPATSVV